MPQCWIILCLLLTAWRSCQVEILSVATSDVNDSVNNQANPLLYLDLLRKCSYKQMYIKNIMKTFPKRMYFLHFQNLEYNFRLGQANFIQTFYGNVRTDSGQVLQVRTQKFSIIPPRPFIFTCYKIQRGRRDIACPDSFNSIFCLINLGIGNFMQKKKIRKKF